jgi:Mannosyltransferase (PIG-V)
MSSDTADPAVRTVCPAIADSVGELVPSFDLPASGRRVAAPRDVRSWWGRLRADPARMAAVRDSWRALWLSRALVWAAGVGTLATLGYGPVRNAFNPPGVTRGFGWLGDLLAGPAARWDASWYLVIAHYGYRPDLGAFTSSRTAFFPLYPLGLRAFSTLGLPPVPAGVLLSLLALALALYGIHRLTTLELAPTIELVPTIERGRDARARVVAGDGDTDVPRLAVMVTAFAPMAFFFSAVYSESLYLALSVGVFWCARQGRWAFAGVLGALAVATRSAGIVLALPVLMLYLYGPREDRVPDFSRVRGFPRVHTLAGRLRPRYRLRPDLLWLLLLPAGLGLYMTYLALSGGDALLPFHAQSVWYRHFAGPYLGVWDGVKAAFEGARQLLSLQRRHVYFPAGGSPFVNAGHNLILLAFLIAAVPAIVGVLRRLPLAYGIYVIAALALPLSYPVKPQPLMSLPRFLVVLFPLSIWLAAWLSDRPRARMPALVLSALLMTFFVGEFATWHWVA